MPIALKITGLQSPPNEYKGGPLTASMIFTDIEGATYEVDIVFNDYFNDKESAVEAIHLAMKQCDAPVCQVHTKSFKY